MGTLTHGFGMGFFGWIIPLVFLVLIIYLLQDRGHKKDNSGKSAAQEILDRRYASGGISKEEYETMSKALKEHT